MYILYFVGGTGTKLLLIGLPAGVTKGDIEKLLYASAPDIEAVIYVNILDEGERAAVKVKGLKG